MQYNTKEAHTNVSKFTKDICADSKWKWKKKSVEGARSVAPGVPPPLAALFTMSDTYFMALIWIALWHLDYYKDIPFVPQTLSF